MKLWIAAALLIAPDNGGTAPAAAADPFCVELARIVAAADARTPFAGLPALESAAARPMLGFRRPCGVTTIGRIVPTFLCSDRPPAPGLDAPALAGRIDACLPRAVRGPDIVAGYPEARAVPFRLGRIRISASEGGHYTPGGRQVSLGVFIAP